MHIPCPSLNFQFCGPGNGFDGVKRLHLAARQRRQVFSAGMGLAAQKSSPAEVHDELRVLVENDRTALESRPREQVRQLSWRPASKVSLTKQKANQIGLAYE